MVKTAALSFRVADEVKDALVDAAVADGRSMSDMAHKILRKWLIERGHLEKTATDLLQEAAGSPETTAAQPAKTKRKKHGSE